MGGVAGKQPLQAKVHHKRVFAAWGLDDEYASHVATSNPPPWAILFSILTRPWTCSLEEEGG